MYTYCVRIVVFVENFKNMSVSKECRPVRVVALFPRWAALGVCRRGIYSDSRRAKRSILYASLRRLANRWLGRTRYSEFEPAQIRVLSPVASVLGRGPRLRGARIIVVYLG